MTDDPAPRSPVPVPPTVTLSDGSEWAYLSEASEPCYFYWHSPNKVGRCDVPFLVNRGIMDDSRFTASDHRKIADVLDPPGVAPAGGSAAPIDTCPWHSTVVAEVVQGYRDVTWGGGRPEGPRGATVRIHDAWSKCPECGAEFYTHDQGMAQARKIRHALYLRVIALEDQLAIYRSAASLPAGAPTLEGKA